MAATHPHHPKHALAEPDEPPKRRPEPPKVESRSPSPKPPSSGDVADSETSKSNSEQEEAPEAIDIDMETFYQIVDLDEDDTHEFSKTMAWAYFSQVDTTFVEMDEAFSKEDLPKLSSLGHFLKGSSAALGVAKVQASCEKIQHYGQLRDEETDENLTNESALRRIEPLLIQVKVEYKVAEKWLRNWYAENARDENEGGP